MKPRVVFVFDTICDVRFVDGFATRFELSVLRPSSAKTTNDPRVAYKEMVTPGGRLAFLIRAFTWLIRNRSRYEVVLVLDNLTAALAANASSIFTKRPVIQIEGRTTVEYYKTKKGSGGSLTYWLGLLMVKAMVWINYRMTEVVAPCTRSIAAVSRGPRTEIIPWYGIDTDAFNPELPSEEARRRLDLPSDLSTAIYRSRIAPEKDPETFISAIRLLKDDGHKILALYVGGEHAQFTELAEEAGIDFVSTGHVHPLTELPIWYRASDVMVQTSKAEGLALSTLEAMASGIPVITSAVGGMLETVRPGTTGLLTEPGDPRDVADAIASIFREPELAARLAAGGRRMVEEEFSATVTFDQWEALVKSLL